MTDYVLLDADQFPVGDLLGPEAGIPPGAILARAPDRKAAGRAVAALPGRRVVVRGTDGTYFYGDPRLRGKAYEYLVLCGAYPECVNPDAPWMHPTMLAPSKARGREGPARCAECNRRRPSQRKREGMSNLNRTRAGAKP